MYSFLFQLSQIGTVFNQIAADINYIATADPDVIAVGVTLVIVVAILIAAWNQSAGEQGGGIKLGIKIPPLPRGIK